jgi:hypothetical protein
MNAFETLIDEIKTLVPIYSQILDSAPAPSAIVRFKSMIRRDDIPADLLSFYRAADGCQSGRTADIAGMVFYSLQGIVQSKKIFDDIWAKKQKAGEFFCWHIDWLPFADDQSYDTLAVDLTGKATGMKGCVLQRSKDSFEEDPVCVIAPDFATFIRDWAQRVKQGEVYRIDATSTEPESWSDNYGDQNYEGKYVEMDWKKIEIKK